MHQDLDVAGAASQLLNLGLNHGLAADLDNATRKGNKSPNVLDLSYITENVIGMAMPYEPEVAKAQGGNDIRAVAAFLKRRHEGHFMIWNISEENYNYGMFADQVLEYRFPGTYLRPPTSYLLYQLIKIDHLLDFLYISVFLCSYAVPYINITSPTLTIINNILMNNC